MVFLAYTKSFSMLLEVGLLSAWHGKWTWYFESICEQLGPGSVFRFLSFRGWGLGSEGLFIDGVSFHSCSLVLLQSCLVLSVGGHEVKARGFFLSFLCFFDLYLF